MNANCAYGVEWQCANSPIQHLRKSPWLVFVVLCAVIAAAVSTAVSTAVAAAVAAAVATAVAAAVAATVAAVADSGDAVGTDSNTTLLHQRFQQRQQRERDRVDTHRARYGFGGYRYRHSMAGEERFDTHHYARMNEDLEHDAIKSRLELTPPPPQQQHHQ